MPNLLICFWTFTFESWFLHNDSLSSLSFFPIIHIYLADNEHVRRKLKNTYFCFFLLALVSYIFYFLSKEHRIFIVFFITTLAILPLLNFLSTYFRFLNKITFKISFIVLKFLLTKTLLLHICVALYHYFCNTLTVAETWFYHLFVLGLSLCYIYNLKAVVFCYPPSNSLLILGTIGILLKSITAFVIFIIPYLYMRHRDLFEILYTDIPPVIENLPSPGAPDHGSIPTNSKITQSSNNGFNQKNPINDLPIKKASAFKVVGLFL